MSESCATCPYDAAFFQRRADEREREQERIRVYRRALMILAGQDHQKMREALRKAEDEMFATEDSPTKDTR